MSSKKIYKKIVRLAIFAVMSGLLIAACAQRQTPQEIVKSVEVQRSMEMPASAAEPPGAIASDMTGASTGNLAQGEGDTGVERIVIKDANLSIVVENPPASLDRIAGMAEEMGGFVVTANLYQTELANGQQTPHGAITIRVPAERLNEALDRIKAESNQEPLTATTNSQDVTKEYTDLESRLRNLEAAEAQLVKIMDEAVKTEDVISVFNQLVYYREQIEITKGQIQYYDQAAALSSISAELIADEAVQPIQVGGWELEGTVKDAAQALLDTLKWLAKLLTWIIIWLLPIALVLFVVIGLPIWLIVRARRRSKARRNAPPASLPGETPSGAA